MGALTVVRRPFILSGDPVVLSASPSAPALTPGAELLTNVEFAVDTTGWLAGNGATLTRRDYTAAPDIDPTGGSDDFGLEVASDGTTNGQAYQAGALTAGVWYRSAARAYSPSGNTALNAAALVTSSLLGNKEIKTTQEDQWQEIVSIARCTATNPSAAQALRCISTTAGDLAHFDAPSRKPIPFDQTGVLEYIGDAGVKLGVAKANITVAATYHAGFVVCADSATAPTNSIWTYYDRTAGKAYLMNNATELVAATVAYSAAAELRVMIVGAVTAAYVSLFYGGVFQGTVQGPYDLSAYGNHCHGLQTGSAETVDRFTFTRW